MTPLRGGVPGTVRYRVHGAVPAALLDLHAITPGEAHAFAPIGWFQRRDFKRLRGANIIREPRPGVFYIDMIAYGIDAERRSKRATWTSLAVALTIVGVALSFYRG